MGRCYNCKQENGPGVCTQHDDLNVNNVRLYIPLSLATSGSTLLLLINRICLRPCLYSEVGFPGLKGATRSLRKQKWRHLGVYSPRSTFYLLGDALVRVALTCVWGRSRWWPDVLPFWEHSSPHSWKAVEELPPEKYGAGRANIDMKYPGCDSMLGLSDCSGHGVNMSSRCQDICS
jgi:hypothetical protein